VLCLGYLSRTLDRRHLFLILRNVNIFNASAKTFVVGRCETRLAFNHLASYMAASSLLTVMVLDYEYSLTDIQQSNRRNVANPSLLFRSRPSLLTYNTSHSIPSWAILPRLTFLCSAVQEVRHKSLLMECIAYKALQLSSFSTPQNLTVQ
jgi:hypothetical protein